MAERMNRTLARPSSVRVAFLAPLTGKNAALGQAMVNAAQLAVFDIGGDGFELMPRDTGGTPEGAARAAHEARGSGASLFIGPLFAAEVVAVKPEIETSGLNALTLSTDVSLAQPGLFVMGFAPAPQVERVVAFAASRGIKKFAALIPSGPYGELVGKAFEEAVRVNGGEILFKGGPDDVAALAKQKEAIEALFLPLGGEALRKTVGRLAQAGIEKGKTRLLGTGLWDEPDLAQGQPLLVGGWFAAADPALRERFVKTYQDSFGKEPPRLATLAYDATALAAVLARSGKEMERANLTNPAGFAGLDGVFRLLGSGQIERGLAVNEVTETGSKVVNPSPANFMAR